MYKIETKLRFKEQTRNTYQCKRHLWIVTWINLAYPVLFEPIFFVLFLSIIWLPMVASVITKRPLTLWPGQSRWHVYTVSAVINDTRKKKKKSLRTYWLLALEFILAPGMKRTETYFIHPILSRMLVWCRILSQLKMHTLSPGPREAIQVFFLL